MKSQNRFQTMINLPDFSFQTILTVEQLNVNELIYVHHELKNGVQVLLTPAGSDLKGQLRFQVSYKAKDLGFVVMRGFLSDVYENAEEIYATIEGLQRRKFLPPSGIDLRLEALNLRKVS